MDQRFGRGSPVSAKSVARSMGMDKIADLQAELGRLRSTGTGDCYCDTLGETPCAYCQFQKAQEERDRARKALVCSDCGKSKPYVAICFDCLGEAVGEIAQWHRGVELSDSNGTTDICNQCHTSWPCDAIKALRLLKEAREKLEALEAIVADAGCNLPNPDGSRCGGCGNCRSDRILKGGN